jgi:hypothetical protein
LCLPLFCRSLGRMNRQAAGQPERWQDDEAVSRRPRRLSVSLTGKALETVRELAQDLEISEGEVVRRALAVLKYVNEKEAQQAVLLVRYPDGQTKDVEFVFT